MDRRIVMAAVDQEPRTVDSLLNRTRFQRDPSTGGVFDRDDDLEPNELGRSERPIGQCDRRARRHAAARLGAAHPVSELHSRFAASIPFSPQQPRTRPSSDSITNSNEVPLVNASIEARTQASESDIA